ncbi:hypothetical protein [Tenacibaculum crassostreae]|uniref:hypothetical protein n=1 Tax=Tenacibaculum crassostreae TaxID=502683 RepID=UPI003895316B
MSFLKKNKKWLISSVILLILGIFLAYSYVYKPHQNTESLKTDFEGEASTLLSSIKDDSTLWLNKVVVLSGKVTSKDVKGITLNNSIYCQFREDTKTSEINIDDTITIKGQIIGYDDLLDELKINQCIIKKLTNE